MTDEMKPVGLVCVLSKVEADLENTATKIYTFTVTKVHSDPHNDRYTGELKLKCLGGGDKNWYVGGSYIVNVSWIV